MSTTAFTQHSFTDAVVPVICSSQSIPLSLEQVPPSTNMKDVSNSVAKVARPSAYPKKRPSPYGVSKSRKHASSPLFPAQDVVRRSPRAAKADLLMQRQREAQILAMRREGIYLEEEYRDEIKFYMHEMEVSPSFCLSHEGTFAQSWSVPSPSALYHVLPHVHGPATRDKVAHAPVSC